MAYVLERVSVDAFYGNILLGIFKILEKNPRISDIYLERQQGCTTNEILTWEQLNGIRMPEDLKNFFLATNGFKFVWNYCIGQETLPLGNISISSLQDFSLLTGYNMHASAQVTIVDKRYHLQLSPESKVLQLSQVDEDSKVCLVYLNSRSNPTIWLADEELKWHYLSDKFKQYLLMAIVHLGLPYWQFCFTPQGVPSWVEQMFFVEAPHLLKVQSHINENKYVNCEDNCGIHNCYLNHIDPTIFKSKYTNKSQGALKYFKKKSQDT